MFDTSVITEVWSNREGSRLTLEWTSSVPAGSWYQVYIQGAYAWAGTDTHVTIGVPRGQIDVQIGAVAAGEQTTDFAGVALDVMGFDAGGFSGGLIAPITTRAYLAWAGVGASLYRIFSGAAAFDLGGFDAGIMDGAQLGQVTGIEQGLSTDGFDLAAFNVGGFETPGGNYSWTSDPLTRGNWTFTVVPYDAANSSGMPSQTTVTINAPPRPPAPNTAGDRLIYTYDPATFKVTLNWLASAG